MRDEKGVKPSGQNEIQVRFQKRFLGVNARWVRRVLSKTLAFEKKANGSIGVFLVDNKEIRKINKRYLSHDYATDVISFGLDESDHLGDLAVSAPMAKSVAAELGISFKEELARYLVHGTLHLLGYDDKNSKDKKRMFKRQEDILLCINQGH